MKIEIEAQLSLAVNGRTVEIKSEPITRLSKVLREELGLTATKVGCDAGDCGACTVLINGKPACACLVAVGQLEGAEIITIEGLAPSSAAFDRLQKSFLRHGAAQCGICTPGMLVSAVALIEKNPRPSETQVQDALGFEADSVERNVLAPLTKTLAARTDGRRTAEQALGRDDPLTT